MGVTTETRCKSELRLAQSSAYITSSATADKLGDPPGAECSERRGHKP